MNTAENNIPYFQSETVARVGDIIASGLPGDAEIIGFPSNGEAFTRNIHTGETFFVLVSSCDLLRRP